MLTGTAEYIPVTENESILPEMRRQEGNWCAKMDCPGSGWDPEGGNRSPVKPRIYPSLFLLPGTSARNPGVACQEFHPGKAVRIDNLQKIKGNVPIKPLDFFISTTIFS